LERYGAEKYADEDDDLREGDNPHGRIIVRFNPNLESLLEGIGLGWTTRVAGGPGGKNWGIKVVRAKVNAWNSEKIVKGSKVRAMGFDVHQNSARSKY
jgi:hypothetical protein